MSTFIYINVCIYLSDICIFTYEWIFIYVYVCTYIPDTHPHNTHIPDTHPHKCIQGPQRSARIPLSKIIINNETVNKDTSSFTDKNLRDHNLVKTRFKPSKTRASMYIWIYVYSCSVYIWWTTHKKPTQITNKSFFVYMNTCIFIYVYSCMRVELIDNTQENPPKTQAIMATIYIWRLPELRVLFCKWSLLFCRAFVSRERTVNLENIQVISMA